MDLDSDRSDDNETEIENGRESSSKLQLGRFVVLKAFQNENVI